MTRIDHETAAQIRTVLMLCRFRGTDPVIALDTAGLLRYKDKLHEDILAGMELLILTVQHTPVQLLNHHDVPRTPLDLKRFILDLLESVKKGAADGKAAQ